MALGEKHPLWRKPKHHLDLPEEHNHVHWVELFYDLIHVVAVFLLGNYLSHHHDLAGFIAFAIIFFSIWLAWGETSVYNSLYVNTDWLYRLFTAFQTLSVMFMAASIPAIEPSLDDPGKGFFYFTIAYGINRIILGIMYYRSITSKAENSSLAKEQSIRFFTLGVLFIVTAFLPKVLAVWVFISSVIMTQLFYFIPRLTIMRLERFTPRITHFSERFALLLLIVNGEGFFKLVITLSQKGIYKVAPEVLFNVAFGGFAIFVLTWTYFDIVGNRKIRKGNRYLYINWTGHMFLMMAAIMIGVALAGEVYVGFNESYPLYYGILGCVGLALYLACILVIQQSVENPLAQRFVTPGVMGLAIFFALFCLVVFPHVPAYVGNALWGLGVFTPLTIGITRGYLTLSKETNSNRR